MNNYFVVERSGKTIDNFQIINDDKEVLFENMFTMSFNDLKQYEHIDVFVVAVMDATNQLFDEGDEPTLITLVGDDDVFIWSILINGEGDGENIRYAFINWLKEGKKYRYEKN